MHELPSYIQFLAFCSLKVFRLMQSSEEAAESVIDAALAPPVRHSVFENSSSALDVVDEL